MRSTRQFEDVSWRLGNLSQVAVLYVFSTFVGQKRPLKRSCSSFLENICKHFCEWLLHDVAWRTWPKQLLAIVDWNPFENNSNIVSDNNIFSCASYSENNVGKLNTDAQFSLGNVSSYNLRCNTDNNENYKPTQRMKNPAMPAKANNMEWPCVTCSSDCHSHDSHDEYGLYTESVEHLCDACHVLQERHNSRLLSEKCKFDGRQDSNAHNMRAVTNFTFITEMAQWISQIQLAPYLLRT